MEINIFLIIASEDSLKNIINYAKYLQVLGY